jgi:hypothetical protein
MVLRQAEKCAASSAFLYCTLMSCKLTPTDDLWCTGNRARLARENKVIPQQLAHVTFTI